MPNNTSVEFLREIKQKTIRGAFQLIIREVIMKVIVVFGQLLLVRLLSPSVFGIFAIISFIIGMAEIFADIGLNLAIIQKKEQPTKEQLSTIFYIKFFLTILTVLILNTIFPFLTFFYHQFSSTEIFMLRLLSLTLFLNPLKSIIYSLLERELRYKDIAFIDIAGIISYYSTSLLLAFLGLGIWSFIIAVILKSIIESAITFFIKPFIPLLKFNFKSVRSFINVGKYFQLGFFLAIIHNSIIPVIAGPRIPLSQVGFLDWSYNISSFPRVFIENLGRVSFSSFSRIQDKKELISSSLEKAFDMLTITTIFFIVTVFVFGSDLIHYFLNDKWIPALPALKWYVASIFFMNGTGLLGHALMAIGRTKEVLVSNSILTFFEFLGSFLLLQYLGFSGIAFGFFIITAVTYFSYVMLCKYAGISVRIWGTIVSSFFVFLTTYITMVLLNIIFEKSFLALILKLFVSFVGYIGIIWLAFPKTLKQSANLLTSYLK